MYKILLESHSGFRYIVFILLVIAIAVSFYGWFSKTPYQESNRKLNLFAMISAHIQLLLGIALYTQSPLVQFDNMKEDMKDWMIRYWTTEHSLMMLIAIALITVGHARAKRNASAMGKHSAIAVFYSLGLIVIVTAIFMSGRGLFGMTH